MRESLKKISCIETASERNFFSDGYGIHNPDVRKSGIDPWQHFIQYGRLEGRQQITRALDRNSDYRKKKFVDFASTLDLGVKATEFPVAVGEAFDLINYVSESANCGFWPFVEEIEENPQKRYLDLGCGLRSDVYENCLYLEVYPSICADVIAGTNCKYPFKDEVFDGIGCFSVLEHTRQPWIVVSEIYRMLKPGGKAFIDWPFLQPLHGYPDHYFNATREGLRSMFVDQGFFIEQIKTFGN